MKTASSQLTQIIRQWQAGDKQAESQLYQFAYLQLRHIAQQERERSAVQKNMALRTKYWPTASTVPPL